MADWVVKTNIPKLSKEIRKAIGRRPQEKREILWTIGLYMTRSTKQRFDRQRDPGGVPWRPLHPLTTNTRKRGQGRAGRGYKALLDEGYMKRSIRPRFADKSTIAIGPGTRIPYAIYHQRGATWTRTRKQAWWMVFNLYGFDPRTPYVWAWAGDISGLNRNQQSFLGWRRASRLVEKLTGSTAFLPQRAFAGINKRNMTRILKIIAEKYVVFAT